MFDAKPSMHYGKKISMDLDKFIREKIFLFSKNP